MPIINRPDPTRAALREVATKKRDLEAQRAKLTLARNKAAAVLADAVAAIEAAEAVLADAQANVGRAAAAALTAGGDQPPLPPGFVAMRAAIVAAKDRKFVAEATLPHLDEKLADVERELAYLPLDAARRAAVAPFLRQTLDSYYDGLRGNAAALRTIEIIAADGLVLPEMRLEIDTLRGLVMAPPGAPGLPIVTPDAGPLVRALAALETDPETVLVGAVPAASVQ